jgi:hypothetical protein
MKGENKVREYESETQGIDFHRKYFVVHLLAK